jgi:hypothetical protein
MTAEEYLKKNKFQNVRIRRRKMKIKRNGRKILRHCL